MDIVSIVKTEVQKLKPNSQLVLFGSRARGDSSMDSDWDFLIILDQESVSGSEKERIRDNLYELELEYDQVLSSIIFTTNEWNNLAVTPLYKTIMKEGIRA